MSPKRAGSKPRAMVLGGYGLIGSACLRALGDVGFDVVGLGLDPLAAWTQMPHG